MSSILYSPITSSCGSSSSPIHLIMAYGKLLPVGLVDTFISHDGEKWRAGNSSYSVRENRHQFQQFVLDVMWHILVCFDVRQSQFIFQLSLVCQSVLKHWPSIIISREFLGLFNCSKKSPRQNKMIPTEVKATPIALLKPRRQLLAFRTQSFDKRVIEQKNFLFIQLLKPRPQLRQY